MDAIIETLTLAIVLLIIGMACVVIGFTGLLWITARDKRRRDRVGEAPNSAGFPLISARQRTGSDYPAADSRRDEVASFRLPGHP